MIPPVIHPFASLKVLQKDLMDEIQRAIPSVEPDPLHRAGLLCRAERAQLQSPWTAK